MSEQNNTAFRLIILATLWRSMSGGLLFDCLRHSQQECTDEEGIRKNFPAINRIEVDILPNIIYNLR